MVEYAANEKGVFFMLEYIVEHFRNNSQFINDIDGLDNYLSGLEISMDEKNKLLREVFEYNNKICSILKEENKRLERIIAARQHDKVIKPTPVVRENLVVKAAPTPMEVDVNVYMERLKQCVTLEDIEQILPEKGTDNYYHIVYTILLKLYEDVIDFKRLLHQERQSSDTEAIEYFNNEIEQMMFKIEFIKSLMKKETKKVELKTSQNELIFLKTNYGNICALSDMKDIALEYYDQFYELLESICDGSFKNFKTFTSNDNLKGLCEVRGDQARIIYDRISNNVYIIIYMFIKKTDKNAAYHASLQNRNELYKSSYAEIKGLLDLSDSYLEENRKIKNKLYRMLTRDNKVKKIGEIHE